MLDDFYSRVGVLRQKKSFRKLLIQKENFFKDFWPKFFKTIVLFIFFSTIIVFLSSYSSVKGVTSRLLDNPEKIPNELTHAVIFFDNTDLDSAKIFLNNAIKLYKLKKINKITVYVLQKNKLISAKEDTFWGIIDGQIKESDIEFYLDQEDIFSFISHSEEKLGLFKFLLIGGPYNDLIKATYIANSKNIYTVPIFLETFIPAREIYLEIIPIIFRIILNF